MSTPAEDLITTEVGVERRFYPRVLPYALISLDFAEDNPGMVLNVSENGLLVSTPAPLAQNFVSRVSLPLNGLARPIEVWARVVWTSESNRAGLQLLDLSEHDRERIRKWAALEGGRSLAAEASGVGAGEPAARETADGAVARENLNGSGETAKVAAAKPRLARWILAAGVPAVLLLGLGLAVTLRGSPLHGWLARSFRSGLRAAAVSAAKGVTKTPVEQPKAGIAVANVVKTEPPSAPPATKDGADAKSVAPVVKADAPKAKLPKEPGTSATTQLTREPQIGAGPPAHDTAGTTKHGESGKMPEVAETVAAPKSGGEVSKQEKDGAQGIEKENEGAPSTEAPAAPENRDAGAAQTNEPPADTVAPKEPAAVDPRVSATPRSEGVNPSVVVMETPQSRVLTVKVANQAKASRLHLPGERVLQGTTATMHIERSLVIPPARSWSSGERKEKAVIGDLLSRVDPQPPRALPATDTRVTLRALVGKDGQVERLMPVNGPVALVSSATRAVRQWRFQPTFLDGKAVETEAQVVIEFRTPGANGGQP